MLLAKTRPWRGPDKSLKQLAWDEPRVELMLVRVPRNITEPLCEGLCIAVFAAGADFDAAAHRVPGRFHSDEPPSRRANSSVIARGIRSDAPPIRSVSLLFNSWT